KQIPRPSVEGDKAIAKGIFRFTLRSIQEDALTQAQAILKVMLRQKKVDRLPEGDCPLSERKTLYGLNRLIDNYWTPMKTGIG
ncbi:hypothetical protein NL529_32285, partial [Klebsiella pneumoniae]|nr:hypothetical protein [Klebsiella pneumoniae]